MTRREIADHLQDHFGGMCLDNAGEANEVASWIWRELVNGAPMSARVFEGALEDICVAADSYGNHDRPCVLDLLDYFEELDRARVPRNQPIRLRVTVEILPTPEKP